MQRDNALMFKLLSRLQEIEASKQPGDKYVPIQPNFDETSSRPGFTSFTIKGYTADQINEQLHFLLKDKLIDGEGLTIGIFFDRLTQEGIDFLKKNDALRNIKALRFWKFFSRVFPKAR